MANDRLHWAIGLMSGTSMDGIDVALIRSDGLGRVAFGPVATTPYDPAFAYLALRALGGLPLSLPSIMGVSRPMTGGVLHRAP